MGKHYQFLFLFFALMTVVSVYGQHPSGSRDTIIVHPGWPMSREGKNERGGIYCNLDQDDDLEIVYTIGNFVYAFNMNGSEVPGWPVELDYPTDGVAAFGDINGDGKGEVVVTTHQPTSYNDGKIYALARNGSNIFGFPVTTEGGSFRSPVLADLDQDGNMEIIVAVRKWPEGFIHVYDGNGTMFPGWPQRLDYIPAAEVAVGDIDGDEIPEIIAQSYYSLNIFNTSGMMLPGFPFTPGNDRVFSYSAPVLADIDEDGNREIIFGDHSISTSNGRLYVLKNDGTDFPNFPKNTSHGLYAPPSVGDIDGDGTLDIVVGEFGANTGMYKVYAWNGLSGDPLPGFPIQELNSINNQIILADLDGDGEIELMFDDNTSAGIYLGYNHDGTPMDGWPLEVNGTSFYINPFVADLNHDGILEISGGGYVPEEDRTYIYLWETETEMNDDLAILPIFQYNTRHNGVAGDFLMVGTPGQKTISSDKQGLTLFPNPASEWMNITIMNPLPGKAEGSVFDISGKYVKTFSFTTSENQSVIQLDIRSLSPGPHLLQLQTQEVVLSAIFMVSR